MSTLQNEFYFRLAIILINNEISSDTILGRDHTNFSSFDKNDKYKNSINLFQEVVKLDY